MTKRPKPTEFWKDDPNNTGAFGENVVPLTYQDLKNAGWVRKEVLNKMIKDHINDLKRFKKLLEADIDD